MKNRITLEEAEAKMKALAAELYEHGYQYFLMTVDLCEKKTKLVYRQNEDMSITTNNMMTVAMELAASGVPVPLLMSAIAYGNQIHQNRLAGRETEGIERTEEFEPENDWPEEVFYENKNLH
jgi:hypothetical protein